MNAEDNRAYCRAWYVAHRDEKREQATAYYRDHAPAMRQNTAAYYRSHREAAREYSRAYRARVSGTPWQRNRQAARDAVKHAVRRGELQRDPCAECGSAAQAHHHHGYEPQFHLDVIWLCRTHHGQAHRTVAA